MRTKREATEVWVNQYQRTLDFILPGKPVEKSYIESFNDHAGDPKPEKYAGSKLRGRLEVWSCAAA